MEGGHPARRRRRGHAESAKQPRFLNGVPEAPAPLVETPKASAFARRQDAAAPPTLTSPTSLSEPAETLPWACPASPPSPAPSRSPIRRGTRFHSDHG